MVRNGEAMSVLDESLREVLRIDGARAAVLIDVATGMIVASAGDLSAGLPQAAASMAEEILIVAGTHGLAFAAGAVEEIAVLTEQRCHLVEVLDPGTGSRPVELLLFVDVDRSMTNVALAGLQVRQLLPGLLG
jgi:hypothetical protein